MPPRRSKTQLIGQILTACQGDGARKTKIVYQVNMNFNIANSYLDLLTKKGLLEAIQGKHTIYKTTAKGEKALECLRAIEEIYS